MKIFVDTANLSDIEAALKRGFVRGVTTNPSLLAKEPKSAFEEHIRKIVDLLMRWGGGIHLSVEVFSAEPAEMSRQAREFKKQFKYSELSIKIPVGWNELEVIRELSHEKISVNCTCCMTVNQAVMAAAAGARYVSLFVGRIRDGADDEKNKAANLENAFKQGINGRVFAEEDFDPWYVLRTTRKILDAEYPGVQIIAGSMRSPSDVKLSAENGAHVATVQPKFFPAMVSHFKTTEVIGQFLSDFEKWMS